MGYNHLLADCLFSCWGLGLDPRSLADTVCLRPASLSDNGLTNILRRESQPDSQTRRARAFRLANSVVRAVKAWDTAERLDTSPTQCSARDTNW